VPQVRAPVLGANLGDPFTSPSEATPILKVNARLER